MTRRLAPESLSSASARHPVRTVVVWVVALVVGFMTSSALLDSALTGDAKLTNNPESVRAQHLLEDRLGADTIGQVLIMHSGSMTLDDQAFANRINAVLAAAPEAWRRLHGESVRRRSARRRRRPHRARAARVPAQG